MRFVYQLEQAEGLRVEPSAAAGLAGPAMLLGTAEGRSYLRDWQLEDHLAQSTHLVWTTGGLFVPPAPASTSSPPPTSKAALTR